MGAEEAASPTLINIIQRKTYRFKNFSEDLFTLVDRDSASAERSTLVYK